MGKIQKIKCMDSTCSNICTHQIKRVKEYTRPRVTQVYKYISDAVSKPKLPYTLLTVFSIFCSAIVFPMPTLLTTYVGQHALSQMSKICKPKIRQVQKWLNPKLGNRNKRTKKIFSKRLYKVKKRYIDKLENTPIGGKNGEQILFEGKISDRGILFEMDSGASLSIISLDVIQSLDKNFKYSNMSKAQKLFGVTGKRIKTHGVYNLTLEVQNTIFTFPITVIDRPGIFLLGRDFMIYSRASLIYNEKYNGFELQLNSKSKLSRIQLTQPKTLAPFQQTKCVFRVRHASFDSYMISNSGLEQIKTQRFININKNNHNECSLVVKNLTKEAIQLNRLELHIFRIDKRKICTTHTLDNLHNTCENTPEITNRDDYSHILQDSEILENLEDDQRAGVDIGSLIYVPRKTYQEYYDSIDTSFPYVKERIAKFYVNSKVVAATELDCGELLNVPKLKLTVKAGKTLPRQTKPYKLSYIDSLHVKCFIEYLCAYNLCRPAPADRQFGSPCFLIPRKEKDRQPRTIGRLGPPKGVRGTGGSGPARVWGHVKLCI